MAIIVEGFDNSGKSTLAASFGLEVVHPGPRPKTAAEVRRCLEDQRRQARLPVVMDRVTALSNPLYGTGEFSFEEAQAVQDMLRTHHCILIYCRPPLEVIKDFGRHVPKDYDEINRVRWLENNAERIVARYDRAMAVLPHMVYDYTNPDKNVLDHAYLAQFTIGGWKQCQYLMKT